MSTRSPDVQDLIAKKYKHGFVTDIESETVPPGLNEETVRWISARKGEPEWRLIQRTRRDHDWITILWDDPDFEMPLPVWIGDREYRVEMTGGRATLVVERGTTVEVDPLGHILASPSDR